MNRSERRRQARRKQPVLIAGEGIAAASLGHHYEARPHAELPGKVPGRHRWIATGVWVVGQDMVAKADRPDPKFLDNENLMHLALGCWDCERPLGAIQADSTCPASGAD